MIIDVQALPCWTMICNSVHQMVHRDLHHWLQAWLARGSQTLSWQTLEEESSLTEREHARMQGQVHHIHSAIPHHLGLWCEGGQNGNAVARAASSVKFGRLTGRLLPIPDQLDRNDGDREAKTGVDMDK